MAKEKVTKKTTKKMSPYNNFMKTELAKVKKENPDIAHKDVSCKNQKNLMTLRTRILYFFLLINYML
ncbi:hypothetical protein RMATCC62417_11162 [Rhizopus microsporus]|nr:hypothetical protein RMATCC62417_11162 [Rhizopus microsporus]